MKDKYLKDLLFKHYWRQRFFPQLEVQIRNMAGSDASPKLVTDIDVYALKPGNQHSFERVLGDCKTLKGQSPIARAFWLRGVMAYLRSSAGIVLLKLPNIEPDHKLAAADIGVLLLSEKDFEVYDKSVVFPAGTNDQIDVISTVEALAALPLRFRGLAPLTQYLYNDAFQEPSFGPLIRHTIGYLRGASRELDPTIPEHCALLADAAAILSIGIAECAGTIFYQCLHPDQKNALADALKMVIWGGREQYQFYSQLRQKMFDLAGKPTITEPELPEWNAFIQLIRELLERPASGFSLPWILRNYAACVLSGRDLVKDLTADDLLSAKFSMLVLDYVCKASGAPREFRGILVGGLVRVQSDLVGLPYQLKSVENQKNLNAAEELPQRSLNTNPLTGWSPNRGRAR